MTPEDRLAIADALKQIESGRPPVRVREAVKVIRACVEKS